MIETGEGFQLECAVDGDGERAVVVCHPHPAFGGTMETPLVVALAAGFARAGLRALRFNFRGIGGSGGRGEGGLVEERDVAAAFAHAAASARDVAICGYSFGALMAAKAIGRGLCAPRAFVGVGFPTTIIGDHPDRVRDVEAALAAAPSLLVAGTEDQFCEIPRLRAFCAGRPHVELQALPGQGHFFAGPAQDDVVSRAVAFLLRSPHA